MNQQAAANVIMLADATGYPRSLTDQFLANQYAAVTLNSGSGTTPQTILSANTGGFYFVKVLQITLDPTCTIASAGMVNIAVTDTVSGGMVGTLRAYIPASVTAPGIATVIRQTNAPGFFWSASQPSSTLQAAVNTALTAGSIRVSVGYGLTNTLIQNTQ
jgi:hypothetical protein